MAKRRGLSFRRRKRMSDEVRALIRNYVIGCVAAFVLGVLLVLAYGYTITNVGVSMEDGIAHNQKILVNRTSYFLLDPTVNDVIVFRQGKSAHLYIKRVVATPGDSIQIRDGKLFVNDAQVKDDFDKIADPGIASKKIVLGEDEYFVLGDNRNNSEDSRSNTVGMIHKEQIIGKAWFALPSSDAVMKPIN